MLMSAPPRQALPYEEIVARLHADPMLSRARHEDLARLLVHLEIGTYAAGEQLYAAGDAAEHFFVIRSGEVLLRGHLDEAVVSDRCGEEAGLDTSVYIFEATARTPVQAIIVPRNALSRLYNHSPALKDLLYVDLLNRTSAQPGREAKPRAEPRAAGTEKTLRLELVGWIACLLVPAAILFAGRSSGLPWTSQVFLAILAATILMWAFQLVDEFIPGLFALFAVLATGLAPPSVALSGFTSDGFFIAMSILGLGTVIVASGLSYRFLLFLLKSLPNRPVFHDLGLIFTGVLLTPMVPSINNRVTLVHPFLGDMIETLGYAPGSRSATRLAIAAFSGVSILSAVFISSKSPNFVIFGLLSPQEQDRFQFLHWFFAAAVAGAFMLAAYFATSAWLFRHEAPASLSREQILAQLGLLGPMKSREWAALAGIAIFIAGVATAALHRMQPPWLGMAILYGLLVLGFLRKSEFRERVEWPLLLYLSSIIGIVGTFNYLGLDEWLAGYLSQLGSLLGGNLSLFILALCAVMAVVRTVMPISAAIVIFATVLMPIAEHTGVSAWVVGFIVLTVGELWLLPYQCSYYLQMRELGHGRSLYDEKQFLRFNAAMNVFRILALFASIPYWQALGIL